MTDERNDEPSRSEEPTDARSGSSAGASSSGAVSGSGGSGPGAAGGASREAGAAHRADASGAGEEPRDDIGGPNAEGWGRRDLFKALASVPVIGALAYNFLRKKGADDEKKRILYEELGVSGDAPAIVPNAVSRPPSEKLNVGIIGFGGRGQALVQGLGFVDPERMEGWNRGRRRSRRLDDFMSQHDLNVELTAVCDLFDTRAEAAIATSKNDERPGGGAGLSGATRYRTYEELLEKADVDAVIIATPDHWHSRITVAAAQAGKHVYCEKCLTRTEQEVFDVVEAVGSSGIVFQLGHQNRQNEAHMKAREVIQKDILGPVTLVETTTNRNDPVGAWVYEIHEDGSPETIDWAQFQAAAPSDAGFSLERFFRWRCWFDYGTGLSGDLLSHEYDAINQIMDLGIPHSAVASGGIYFFKDGRDVPDSFQVVYEYPDRDLTLVYSATLANSRGRGKVLMGHDATMEVGSGLRVIADPGSTRYEELMDDDVIDTDLPLLTYRPGFKGVDAVTSATEEYFASRGLLYTYRGGRRFDPTHLHVKEWLDVVRNGGETSCNLERAFEEAITCHMATRSLLEGRKVTWDPVQKKIV